MGTYQNYAVNYLNQRNPNTGMYWQNPDVAKSMGVDLSQIENWLGTAQEANKNQVQGGGGMMNLAQLLQLVSGGGGGGGGGVPAPAPAPAGPQYFNAAGGKYGGTGNSYWQNPNENQWWQGTPQGQVSKTQAPWLPTPVTRGSGGGGRGGINSLYGNPTAAVNENMVPMNNLLTRQKTGRNMQPVTSSSSAY